MTAATKVEELCECVRGGASVSDIRDMLLSWGAEKDLLNKEDDDSRTGFHWACSCNREDVVKMMLAEFPAVQLSKQDEEGWSPLHSVASAGYLEICKLLLEHDAEIVQRSSSGATPLHMAAAKGHLAIVRLLLDAGAPVNAQEKYGNTPLTKAAAAGRKNVVEYLLQAGADPLVQESSSGDTALHMAVNAQDVDICLLLCTGFPEAVRTRNKDGQTPLDMAPKELAKTLETTIADADE